MKIIQDKRLWSSWIDRDNETPILKLDFHNTPDVSERDLIEIRLWDNKSIYDLYETLEKLITEIEAK